MHTHAHAHAHVHAAARAGQQGGSLRHKQSFTPSLLRSTYTGSRQRGGAAQGSRARPTERQLPPCHCSPHTARPHTRTPLKQAADIEEALRKEVERLAKQGHDST